MAAGALATPARARSRRWALPMVARLVGFVPLTLFVALHWAGLVSPAASGAFVGMSAAVVVAGAALIAVRGAARRTRIATGVGLAVVLAALAFVVAGVPVRALWPKGWDELGEGLGNGISSMPGVTVPYLGSDAWTRSAILLGGALLLGLASLLAFWPGRRPGHPLLGAIVLGLAYGIALVQHNPRDAVLDGAGFCLLLALFLGLERLRTEQLAPAIACVVIATGAGALIAPALDGKQPWLDYEAIAEQLEPERGTSFTWDHRYGPLDWPRDGRELLRVTSPISAYWKAENLDAFDGTRWYASGQLGRQLRDRAPNFNRKWLHRISVRDRGLSGTQIVGAGTTLRVFNGPDARQEAPGVFETTGDALAPDDTYQADVYVPKPTRDQMRTAGFDYSAVSDKYLELDVRAGASSATFPDSTQTIPEGTRLTMLFAPFGRDAEPVVFWRDRHVDDFDASTLRRSSYGRVFELAQGLRRQASTPYDLVQLVTRAVQRGATYSEDVPLSANPLVTFLFNDRRGYCQQFSGAVALLLRMAGVPARVSTGFTPGRYDASRKEFIVRDLDAHSWVEVYFPGYGWTTFDPTPGASPARSQQLDTGGGTTSSSSGSTASASGPAAPRPETTTPAGAAGTVGPGGGEVVASPAGDGGVSWALLGPGIAVAVLLVLGGGLLLWRGRPPGAEVAPELAELQRALHRTGHTPAPGTTLVRLEQLLGGGDGAAYVQAIRRRRFGAGSEGPSPDQRRALRHELAAGLGLRGKLRAWWALPPDLLVRRRYPAS